jgi:sulfite dehydrogenase
MNRRRHLLRAAGGMGVSMAASMAGAGTGLGLALAGMPARAAGARGRVVVVGGGFGGATAARFLKRWAPALEVTLIEREPVFVSCPMSNRVIGGHLPLESLVFGYQGLERLGVRRIRGEAVAVDADAREVRLASGERIGWDRAIVSPGLEFELENIPGLQAPGALEQMPVAFRAGAETRRLREQLQAMPDGGVFVMHIPLAPYRCPAAPYERACQVADYFRREKPRSKVIVLDANPEVASKKALFMGAFNGLYRGMIEYRPNSELSDVDVGGKTVKLVFDDVAGDVINVIPPQRSARIAQVSGLVTANRRWCAVDWHSMASTAVPGVHVLGDATLAAPVMPKSATLANQQAKLAAGAIIDLLAGEAVNAAPTLLNVCYSFIDGQRAGHIATVHAWDATEGTMTVVKGSGGVSTQASEREGLDAMGWARNVWGEALGG